MSNYFFLMLLLLPLGGCTEQAPLSGTVKLPADGDWGATVYLIQPRSLDEAATSFTGQVLDSAAVQADGGFVFKTMPDAPEPVLLELAVQRRGERFPNKLENENPAAANYFPIIWQNGDRLEVTASAAAFQKSFFIKNPSPENAALTALRDARMQAWDAYLRRSDAQGHDDALLLEAEAATMQFKSASMEFAQKTEHLLPALMAFRWVSPENDYERTPEFVVSQCEKWQTSHAAHPWVAQLCQKADRRALPVLQGDLMPDAALPMLSGDTLSLYQLLGQRLTIVDLWASWCAPCRRENREVLAPLWDRYHGQGLQIVGYALEGSEGAWKKAIERDGASRWLHASHLLGDEAPLMETLRIQTIPANFILNNEGKVLAKNLHGEELEQFVGDYFGE